MAAETGDVVTADGKKLGKVEALKRAKDGVDVWEDIFRYGTNPDPKPLEEVVASWTLSRRPKEQWEQGVLDRNDPAAI